MSFHPLHIKPSPLHAEVSLMYHDQVPGNGTWYGLRTNMCVAWLIESGSVQVHFNKRTLYAGPGQWVFQSPGLQLDQIFDPETRLISIRYHLRWSNGHNLFSDANTACLYASNYPQLKKIALNLIHHCNTDADTQTPLHILRTQELLHQWLQSSYTAMIDLGFSVNPQQHIDTRMAMVLDILQESLHLHDVPYDHICAQIQLSRVHLNRLFKNNFNHSPKQRHDMLRIAYAQKLLNSQHNQHNQHNSHSSAIKNIAADLGFRDSSQFSKWFRRLDGQTPSQARKNIGNRV